MRTLIDLNSFIVYSLSGKFSCIGEESPFVTHVANNLLNVNTENEICFLWSDLEQPTKRMHDTWKKTIESIKEKLSEIFQYIPITVSRSAEFDTIALAASIIKDGQPTAIQTTDGSFFQLISPKVIVMDYHGNYYDEKYVCEHFTIPANKLIYFWSLSGVPVKYLRGIPGLKNQDALLLAKCITNTEHFFDLASWVNTVITDEKILAKIKKKADIAFDTYHALVPREVENVNIIKGIWDKPKVAEWLQRERVTGHASLISTWEQKFSKRGFVKHGEHIFGTNPT